MQDNVTTVNNNVYMCFDNQQIMTVFTSKTQYRMIWVDNL